MTSKIEWDAAIKQGALLGACAGIRASAALSVLVRSSSSLPRARSIARALRVAEVVAGVLPIPRKRAVGIGLAVAAGAISAGGLGYQFSASLTSSTRERTRHALIAASVGATTAFACAHADRIVRSAVREHFGLPALALLPMKARIASQLSSFATDRYGPRTRLDFKDL